MLKTTNYTTNFYIICFMQFFMAEITGTSMILFLLSKGLDLFQINLLLAAFFIGIILFEIPTGAFADIYGRRLSVSMGFFLLAIASVIIVLTKHFYLLIAAQVIAAIGTTMQSGAFEAWIVDAVKHSDKPHSIGKLFSNAGMLRNLSGIVCGLFGGYLASVQFEIPWWIGIGTAVCLTVFCMIFMQEPYRKLKDSQALPVDSMKTTVRESTNFLKANPAILSVFIFALCVSFSSSAANAFQQPRLVGLAGTGIWVFGWIKAGYSGFMLLGSFLIGFLSRKQVADRVLLILSSLMLGIWLILAGIFNQFVPVLIFFLLYETGRGMYNPAKSIFLNKRIPSEKRATILSVESLISQIGMVLGLVITGCISARYNQEHAQQWPMQLSWIICGIVALFSLVFVMHRKEKAGTDPYQL